jgi:photosystem II stability/assembly factor-like uncharacterized protein
VLVAIGAAGVLSASTAASRAGTLLGLIDTGELYSSADGGATWSLLSTLPVRDAVGLQARGSTSEFYLASRSGSMYASLNGGSSWAAVGAVPAGDVEDLLARSDGALMLLTASGSVYRSIDQAATFSSIAAITGANFASLTERSDARLYALTRTGEVYESEDLGFTWVPRSAIAVSDAESIRSIGPTLFVITETGDIARSDDAAASWTIVGTLSQVGMRGLVRDGTSLIAASREGHVASSVDGVSWTWRGSINQLVLTALATDAPATGVADPPTLRGALAIGAPTPNPAPGGAGIYSVRLAREETIVLELYDPRGRLVARREPELLPAGSSAVAWDPGVRHAGVRFARLRTPGGSASTKVVVLP